MADSPSFEVFLAALRARDESAARTIVERYGSSLLRVARNRLSSRLRAKLDPEDIVQSVYRSVCDQLFRGASVPADWGELWGLLHCCTVRKCSGKAEHYQAGRRDVRREAAVAPLSAIEASRAEDGLAMEEEIDALLTLLPADRDRDILLLKLQGYSQPEIARQIECSQSKVSRTLALATELLRRALGGETR
ncbi:MAG: RNA polymerase sigma factor [Gemmataceae bacterium]